MRAMKIGLMVPQNNTTMERELASWLGAGTHCTTVRIPRPPGMLTEETVPAYVSEARRLAASYADAELDVVVYGCTAAGFIMGPQADAQLAGDLERLTGKRVVTTAGAMVQVLQDAGDIAVVTPYPEEVNRRLASFLEKSAVHVKRLASFGAANVEELGRITSKQVAALARETMTEDCDALFIACSQLPTYEIVAQLERDFARPVWSSIQATARAVRQ
jgi:maleate cis-trans isomerase